MEEGDSSSPSSSDDDLGDDSDEFQIEAIRGKWGHRRQQGRKGPQGLTGPVITPTSTCTTPNIQTSRP